MMIYLNTSIINTTADVLIVPCSMSGKILPGLQTAIANKYGKDYEEEFASDVENSLVKVGNPGIFKGEGDSLIILHIPVSFSNESPVLLSDLMSGLREAMGFMAGSEELRSVAIGPMGDTYSWDTLEGICERLEMIYGDKGIEFVMYPSQTDEDEEDEELSDAATAVVELMV